MNWFDITCVIIGLLSVIKGFFTGMILSLTRLVSIISGLIVAYKYNQPVVDYIDYKWHWVDSITGWVSSRLQNIDYLSLFSEGKLPVIDEISFIISKGFLEIAAFLFLLLVTTRIIQWIGAIITSIIAFTPLVFLDRIAGVVFGLVRGFLIITIIIFLLTPLQTYIEMMWGESSLGNYFVAVWNDSIIVPYFKDIINLLVNLSPNLIPEIPWDYNQLNNNRIY